MFVMVFCPWKNRLEIASTDLELADIFGDTDFDFEICIFKMVGFPDFQVPGFPDFQFPGFPNC